MWIKRNETNKSTNSISVVLIGNGEPSRYFLVLFVHLHTKLSEKCFKYHLPNIFFFVEDLFSVVIFFQYWIESDSEIKRQDGFLDLSTAFNIKESTRAAFLFGNFFAHLIKMKIKSYGLANTHIFFDARQMKKLLCCQH